MRVLVQWSTALPGDWVEVDSADWAPLPKKPDPVGGETVDGAPGWVHHLCVQGVCFTADHYAVEDLAPGATVNVPGDGDVVVPAAGGCRVYCWSDTEPDYPAGYKNAKICTYLPCAPDARFGGAYNTRQWAVYYAEPVVRARMPATVTGGEIRSYSDFVPPAEAITRHGKWLTDASNDEHDAARTTRGWREWTEGVPAEELDAGGCIRCQRGVGKYARAKGTKTYFCKTTDLATGVHAAIQTNDENEMVRFLTQAQTTEASGTIGGAADGIAFVFTTSSSEPNDASWPTGNYRCQLDVSAVGGDITYGLLDQGGSVGHFARVNAGLTTDSETKQQTESAFLGSAGAGLQLATTGSVSWSTGAAGDRFECCVSIARPANHGNQSLTLNLNDGDAFADGPWVGDLADAIAVTDSVTGEIVADGVLFDRTVTDAIGVADDVVREVSSDRSQSDAVAVAEQTTIEAQYSKDNQDTIVVADGETPEVTFDRTEADAVAVADAAQGGLEFARSASDAIAVADAAVREMFFDRAASDAVVVADNTIIVAQYRRDSSDVIVVADASAAGLDVLVQLADAVAVADAAAREMSFDRQAADAMSVADAAVRFAEYDRSEADAVVVVDASAAGLDVLAAASDVVAVADAVAREMGFDRDTTDAVVLVEQTGIVADYGRDNTDAIVVADDQASEATFDRTANDAIAVADALAAEFTLSRVVTDAVSVVDQLVVVAEYVRDNFDTIVAVDAETGEVTFDRAASDAVVVADAAAAEEFTLFDVVLADAVAVVDAIQRTAIYERSGDDAVVVVDFATTGVGLFDVLLADAVVVTDAVARVELVRRIGIPNATIAVERIAAVSLSAGRFATVKITTEDS